MQKSAGSVPGVSTEAETYEPFLHAQLPFFSWSEQSLQHADMWQKTFFSKVLASIATGYWPVTTHRAEDVFQWEKHKNSKAAPWKNRKKEKE